jgi:predicted DNA-binding antitoxin AbrB/MazE fold protein
MTDNSDTNTVNDNNAMADNPSVRMTPQDNPVRNVKSGSKTEIEAFAKTLEWCRRVSKLENCPRLAGGTCAGYTECTCLHALRSKIEGHDSTVLYMVARWSCYVASLDNGMRSSLEIEWIKRANVWAKEHSHSSTKRKGYLLQIKATVPSSDEALPLEDEANVQPLKACKHAMMLILGIGKSRWSASAKHAAANTFPVHGLKGKPTNKNAKKKARVEFDYRDYFAKLQDDSGELTDVELREGEEEKIELPDHMTKRGLYKKFCWELGWKLVCDVKGNYTRSPRPYDMEFLEGSERKETGAWSSFNKYWEENYPNLKIRAKDKPTNKNAKKKARVDSDYRDYFAKLQDDSGVPATGELTGVGLREGEEEKIELPDHMTKRGLYKKFCWELGWKLVCDVKGNYTRSPRPYDMEFLEGSERKEIGAWSSFNKYWEDNHPNLKIRAS